MPCLRIKVPGQPEETHPVSGPRVTIGRRPENTIQILDRSVSAFHAELIAVNGHYRLRDLESTNRCFVRGEEVAEYHLRERCSLSFGQVQCEYDPAAEAPPGTLARTQAQLEHEVAFLRSENSSLREQLHELQRHADIIASAQILRDRASERPAPRDNSADLLALEVQLEQLQEELAVALRERDAARAAAGMLHMEKTTILKEIRASGVHRQRQS